MDTSAQDFFEKLERELPDIVLRNRVHTLTGGLIANKTLANADSLLAGPAIKLWVGSRVAYPKDALIQWLKRRVRYEQTL